jgi:hypothetical protein
MLMGRGTYEYFADAMPKQTGPYGGDLMMYGRGRLSKPLLEH